jgi:uncharacterized membrane protein
VIDICIFSHSPFSLSLFQRVNERNVVFPIFQWYHWKKYIKVFVKAVNVRICIQYSISTAIILSVHGSTRLISQKESKCYKLKFAEGIIVESVALLQGVYNETSWF